jgi:hypothetical protein
VADEYHRQRQNIHFQSLYYPGIVCGLGVRVIKPPEHIDDKKSFPHWLEIQPGIAIDQAGNPIIVDPETDRTFPLTKIPTEGETLTVYVVVNYEPAYATPNGQETIRERFGFENITESPNGKFIELCRIELTNPIRLTTAPNGFEPAPNQLDFRGRRAAQLRSQDTIRVAQIKLGRDFDHDSDFAIHTLYNQSRANLVALMQARQDPTLQGHPEVPTLPLGADLAPYDVLFLPNAEALLDLDRAESLVLQQYLQAGGGLLVEMPLERHQQLDAVQTKLQQLANLTAPLTAWEQIPATHPLRRSPFLFGTLPQVHPNPIQVYNSGGIILIAGQLSSRWGLNPTSLQLSRSEIRDAQEFGTNLLHFLWQGRRLQQLWQWETPLQVSPAPVHSRS